MINNYKNTEFQLYGYLVQLRELFRANRIKECDIERINENIELIQSRKFNVAVMGEFKRGKSSLINAILGLKILPSDVTPTTATINRITYGNEPSMTIYYNDGTTETADMNNISQYVTMLTEEGLKRAVQIKEAVVQYPTVICQNHVDIIDTPGLNDNINMTKITMNMLPNIDAVIVAVSALSPFSEKETDFVCQLIRSDNVENIVFVVTFIDQIDEDEQEKLISGIHKRICKNVSDIITKENSSEEILAKTKRILDSSLIFGVSSLLALKSFVTGNRELLKQSRFETFKTELYEFLTSQQGVNTIVKAGKNIQSGCVKFEQYCTEKLALMERDLNAIDEKSIVINNYCSEYRKNFESIYKNYEGQLRECLNSILDLKDIFTNSLTGALYRVNGKSKSDIINTLALESKKCFDIANEEALEKVRKQICDIFISIVGRYFVVRKGKLLEPVKTLSEICNLNYISPQALNTSILENMGSIGFPKFQWHVSPVPNPQYFYSYNLMDNTRYAIEKSVKKTYGQWTFYVEKARRWWIEQFDKESASIAQLLNTYVSEEREKKKDEIYFFKNTFNEQKEVILEIRNQTDSILRETL